MLSNYTCIFIWPKYANNLINNIYQMIISFGLPSTNSALSLSPVIMCVNVFSKVNNGHVGQQMSITTYARLTNWADEIFFLISIQLK